MKNKPQNNPQKKVTKIVLVDAFTFTKIVYELQLLLIEFFDLTLPSRGYSTELSQFY